METEKKELTQREIRRKRRIRSQLTAYLSVTAAVCLVIAAGIFGVRTAAEKIQEKREMKEMAEQLKEMSKSEEPEVIKEESAMEQVEIADYTPEDLLEEVIDSSITEMTLEEKVAGLFVITPEALTGADVATVAGSGTENALKEYPVGGLIYFEQNIKSDEQFKEMLASTIEKSKYPLFLAVDEEGGRVTRLAKAGLDVPETKTMREIGASGDISAAYSAANTIGNYLTEYGINLNFAPVADIASVENSAIGDRSFGADAAPVSDMVREAVRGTQDAGLSACVKHFPGLGGVTTDTHEEMAVTQRTEEELKAGELLPFQAGMEAGADMVMVGHIAVPEVSGDNTPASLSGAVITDLLRKKLGYEGIVITDALNMKAVSRQYTSAQAAVMTLQAGADMILMPESFQEAYEGVLAAVADGTLSEDRITQSLKRVYRVKYRSVIEE